MKGVQTLRFLLIGVIVTSWVFSPFSQNPFFDLSVWEVRADVATLTTTSCDLNDSVSTACQDAVSADGGSTFNVGKAEHIDARLQTLSSVSSVNSATFYYDHGPSVVSGTWQIYVTATRDGTVICSVDPAVEASSEQTNSFSCNSITPTQLSNGVWIRVVGETDKGPENVTLDYLRLSVDYVADSNSAPVASAVSIDSGAASVTLNEGTTKNVVCSGTVTDADGFADITSVKADLFRTGVGIGSATDNNNHYQESGDSECVPSGGSGTSETYTCTISVQYYADPTDTGSPNSADNWTCTLTPTDATEEGTAASDTIEMNSSIALSVSETNITYGTVNANTDTGATNQTITVENTGNRDIDPQLSGTNMISGGDSIAVGQQEYSATTFTYSAGTDLSASATTLDITLPQPTNDVTPTIQDTVYWGLGVPGGTPAGTYTGSNTVTATSGI